MRVSRRATFWIAACSLLVACPAESTVEATVEVSQPSDDGITTTTYTNWGNSGYPVEVSLTDAPNVVMRFGKPENRNAAQFGGIKVRLVPGPNHLAIQTYEQQHGLGMRGDTVDVALDLTGQGTGQKDPITAATFDYLVDQTFSCILLNARRRWPEVRFVHLDVVGSNGYPRLRGVHSLEGVPQLGGVSGWSADSTRNR